MSSSSAVLQPIAPRTTSRTMRAAVIEGKNSLSLKTVPMPELRPDEALLRVKYCGICGSDLHVLHGAHPTAKFPVIPGHEFVGELVALNGGDTSLRPGDMVVSQPFFSCGNCQPCAKGRDNVCRSLRFMGAHVNGGFAEYVAVPIRKTYALPTGFDLQLAALVEPIAVAVHDVRRSGIQVGETALVIGGGAIGQLLAIVARHSGASKVVISEPNAYRRGVAERLGFQTVDPTSDGFDKALMEASDSLGFDVVFEASGSRPGVTASTKYAKITGKVMVIGMTKEPYPVDLSAVFAKELVLEGVRIHAQYNFIGAIELLKNEALRSQFLPLMTDVFPMEEIEDAFAFAQSAGDFMKVIVKM
ncbi:MAG: alcohol dehydrogenase catalytic domain-containing protein [Planctomycetaceae bacterium]|nr:alcohol dehydrogenase catalytic domain-containing protein [Planctomycetaceae bacterium]